MLFGCEIKPKLETMKTNTKKILCVIIFLLTVQVVQAQSYQRWIYWVEEPTHELTSQEMGDITKMLYEGEIASSKSFRLSTGVILKIPQPYLFLKYIKIAVQSVRPWATEKDQILDALYTSDRFMWGNDVNVRVFNHWISKQNEKANFTNNYSGEGKNVFFLFIDGIPTIKCDCGNPLELMPEYYSYRHTQKYKKEEFDPIREKSGSSQEPRIVPSLLDDSSTFTPPKTVSEMVLGKVPQEQTSDIFLPKNKFNWKPVIIVGGATVAIGTGLLVYSLLKKKKPNGLVIPGSPVDPTGPMDTTGP